MIKTKVSDSEVSQIVESARLQKCTRNGAVYYETSLQQRNKEHMYIRIETNNKLKIECSLHKLHEKTVSCRYTNYESFSMDQATQIIKQVLEAKGIPPDRLMIYGYEVGLNLNVSKDCREYMDKMNTIGIQGEEKPFYINPKYKDSRVKTTLFHRHIRKHFKVYDKCFEARDKRRNDVPEGNILRIETVYKRVEKMSYKEFFSPENLTKVRDRFFSDWRTVQFERDIQAPKGVGIKKRELCKLILKVEPKGALFQMKEKQANGTITAKEFRTIREFITREWDKLKKDVVFVPSEPENEYRKLLNTEKTLQS